MKIAVLGWGSLLWDLRPEFEIFEQQHEPWKDNGPTLRLEFSRVSGTRKEALTLVLEEEPIGAACVVAYAASQRKNLDDAVCDLRCREGTTLENIGVWVNGNSAKTRGRIPAVVAAVESWAQEKGIGSVVWTDLKSNFEKKSRPKKPFSVEMALRHLQEISAEGKAKAAEYVWRAPAFVQTPLRAALQTAPWFPAAPPSAVADGRDLGS